MNFVTLSVVTYNTSLADIGKVYESICKSMIPWQLYVVDNSPFDTLRQFSEKDARIKYIFNNANIGFGAAHNIAINLAINSGSIFHFVVNPDIYFDGDIITPMVRHMQQNQGVGMMMPQVRYPDGSMQYLPKLLPSPVWILRRKLKIFKVVSDRFIRKYEMRDAEKGIIYNAPVLSGCFTLLNLDALKEVGGYDEKFFLYFEDWDLSRRMNLRYQTLYFPLVSVYHGYQGGANKSLKLFGVWLKSAWHYFKKWGWLFDNDRAQINKQTLAQFK
jgi:GT2 family glycosyltransferase